jgi:hypothetical protein
LLAIYNCISANSGERRYFHQVVVFTLLQNTRFADEKEREEERVKREERKREREREREREEELSKKATPQPAAQSLGKCLALRGRKDGKCKFAERTLQKRTERKVRSLSFFLSFFR